MNLNIPTPYYVVDENLLVKNLEILRSVQDRTGCKIILASKAFSMYTVFGLIKQYLAGVTSSSLHEARLGAEEMGKEVHIFSPGYYEQDFDEIMGYCSHIVFNSFGQWKKYKDKVKNYNETTAQAGKKQIFPLVQRAQNKIQCGIRINPEYSEVTACVYNPCGKYSRLGVTLANFKEDEIKGVDGLLFHALSHEDFGTLERVLKVVEEKFEKYLYKIKWLNMGGGHLLTSPNYDIEGLVKCIKYFQEKYNLEIYMEPGEAIAINAGYLVSSVLDIIYNERNIAILDTSAVCHMPEIMEAPYTPEIVDAKKEGELPYTYRLGGPTCLAGDIIGDYSFAKPLNIGDKLIFKDMATYTMVRNNTFNGLNLPSIVLYTKEGETKIIKTFGYEDFKRRL